MHLPKTFTRSRSCFLGLSLIIGACGPRDTTPGVGPDTDTSTSPGAQDDASLPPGAPTEPQPTSDGSGGASTDPGVTQAPTPSGSVAPSTGDGTTEPPPPNPYGALVGPPYLFAPTSSGFGINVVAADGDAAPFRLRVREAGNTTFETPLLPEHPAADVAQWMIAEREPATEYEYEIFTESEGEVMASGSVVTQRPPGESFTFTLVTDSHIEPRRDPVAFDQPWVPLDLSTYSDFAETTLLQVGRDMQVADADFMVNLGDILDFHLFGFNLPPPSGAWTRAGYLNYRRLLDASLTNTPHFNVVGNWDGENGNFTPEQIAYSRAARMTYAPGPRPDTYPEGGNDAEDYYAFTWGDALFVALNVMTYTPTEHLLHDTGAKIDDWTLGEQQLAWLQTTLANATSTWKFLLIHHTVGGAAGTEYDSVYGRGGGQAARVGEQAIVHDLMLQHGVQVFFYGHDHVFTDMVVDGIHYTLPGSAGAPWKFESAETGYETYWTDSGHGRVAVSPERLTVEFIAVGGELLYQYELTQPAAASGPDAGTSAGSDAGQGEDGDTLDAGRDAASDAGAP